MKFNVLNKAFQDKMKVLSDFLSNDGLGSYVQIRTTKADNEGKPTDAILIKLENTIKTCEIRVFCIIEEEGEIFLSYTQLVSVLNSTTDARTLTFSEHKDEVEIYSKEEKMNFSFSLKAIDLQSEPLEWKTNQSFIFPAHALSNMINTVLPFVSTDDSRINLCGVRMERKEEGLSLKATDGKRAVVLFPRETEQEIPEFNPITIPSKFAKTIAKTFSSYKDDLTIMLSPNCLMIRSEEITMAAALLRENFPNIEKIIPKQTTETLIVNSTNLSKAVKRASVCAEKSRAIFLDLDSNMVTVHAESDSRSISEEVEAHYTGKRMVIAFDYKYLQDLLMVYNSEMITLGMNGSEGKIVAEDDNGTFLVMPKMKER